MPAPVTHAIEPIYLTPNRSTRKDVYTSIDGTYVQEVTYVYTGSGNFKMIAWKVASYNQGLWQITEDSTGAKSVRTFYSGRVTSETNSDGTKTEYDLDDLFRVETARRKGVSASGSYAAQGDVETAYTYDAANHVLTTTTTGGSLSLSGSATYDLSGRVTSQTDVSGLTTNYVYAFDGTNGGSITTTQLPGHTTMTPRDQVVKTWRDGSPKSVTGSAVLNQYSERTLSGATGEGGFLVNTVYTLRSTDLSSPTSAPRWQRSVADWAGRLVRSEAPAYSSGTIAKNYFYYATGQLKKTTETGLAPTYYQYDGQGDLLYTWLDVDNDTNDSSPSPELSGPDRVTRVLSDFYSPSTGLWYQRSRSYVYNQDSSSTALLLSEQRTQLVPYPGSSTDFDNRKVHTEQHGFDVSGNETVQTVLADPSSRISTVTTNVPDSSTDDVVTAFNGLTVAHRTAQNLTTTYGYDDLMRPNAQTDPRLGTTTTAYYTSGTGAKGQVHTVTDPESRSVTYSYDSTMGRLASTTDPLGKLAYQNYNIRGQVIQVWGDTTYPVEYGYDDYGQQTTMSTFRGGTGWTSSSWPGSPGTADTTTWAYENATGLLTSKTDAASKHVDYTYTSRNQLYTRTWSRGVSATYSYDSATGQQTGIDYSDSTPDITYTYNRMGQTATVADVAGTRTFAYSTTTTALSTETYPSYFESRVMTRKYDTSTTGALGRNTGYTLSGASGSGTDNDVSYTYDTYGRFNGITTPSSGPAFSYSFTSGSNLVAAISETSGWTETNTYETHRNLLSQIKGQYGSPVKAQFDYTHDDLGRRLTATDSGEIFARYNSAAITTHYGYNDRSEVTSAQSYYGTSTTDTSSPVIDRGFTYAFDNIGNRTSSSVIGNGGGDTHTTSYTVNALNQVTARAGPASLDVTGFAPTAATVTVNSSTATRQGEYYYKNVTGSQPSWTSAAASSSAGGSETRHAYLPASSETHTYDDDGNLTADGRWTYAWDAENRLISMETVSGAYGVGVPRQLIQFKYDYLGRRVRKTVANWNSMTSTYDASLDRKFLYNGWNLIGEYDVGSSFLSFVTSYVWGLDLSGNLVDGGGVGGLLAIKQVSGSVWHLPYYDANGNLHALVDRSTGTVTAAYEYSPFGETLRANGTYAASNPFRFSTKYADTETHLLYYGYRYFDPSMGRWLGRDPSGESGGLHLYAFCRNNAVNAYDALGLYTFNEIYGGIPDDDVIRQVHPTWTRIDEPYIHGWIDPNKPEEVISFVDGEDPATIDYTNSERFPSPQDNAGTVTPSLLQQINSTFEWSANFTEEVQIAQVNAAIDAAIDQFMNSLGAGAPPQAPASNAGEPTLEKGVAGSSESNAPNSDIKGRAPGLPPEGTVVKIQPTGTYDSRDAAALAVLAIVNPMSIAGNVEYGGYIVKGISDGKYGYTQPVIGGLDGVKLQRSLVPTGSFIVVGDYHTHGNYSDTQGNIVPASQDSYDANHFSPTDKSANDKNWTADRDAKVLPKADWNAGYLGTPSGDFYRYNPGIIPPLDVVKIN